MKKRIIYFFIILLIIFVWIIYKLFFGNGIFSRQTAEAKRQDAQIAQLLFDRQSAEESDPFGDDGVVRILLVGLDNRAGHTEGHCDAIQFFEIDRNNKKVKIIAVPRGTYSPLPPGKGTTSSDYYVSNACGLGGLEYGVAQIEHILGQKADHLVFVGFSQTFGLLREFQLPTAETLQWLRYRRGYAIGEPQRARNHSTFLKQMLLRFMPKEKIGADTAWQYLIYKMARTDLSFGEVKNIIGALVEMELNKYPERIELSMRPAYAVQDMPYDPENLDKNLSLLLSPIVSHLSKEDYSGASEEDTQKQLLENIKKGLENIDFIKWAFENSLWLQIEDTEAREQVHYDLLVKYVQTLNDKKEKEGLFIDYIIEMENKGNAIWLEKGRDLLVAELNKGL